jgi:hypothetical protein
VLSYNGNIFHTKNGGSTYLGIKGNAFSSCQFSLEQNHPNPFTTSTTITWHSAKSSRQTLKVYDMVGNEVTTLVDEFRPAGFNSVVFITENLPAGVYFYQFQADGKVETKKMVIIKEANKPYFIP